MVKSVLLIGLGRFGKHVAVSLDALGHEIMAIDRNEDRVNDALSFVTNAQIGDSTNIDFLASLGIGNYDLCVVAIGNDFQSSLETTSNLKELGARLVVARASRDVHAKFLLRNGADEVVYPEKQIARWTSIRYTSNHIVDYIELDDNHSIFEVSVPRQWVGMSIGQLDIRRKFNINIVAVKQNGKMNVAVSPDTLLTSDKTMLVIGEYKALQKCFHI